MPLRRLVGFSIAGAGAWCAAFIVAGYVFAAALESHLDALGNVALALAGGLALAWALRDRARSRPVVVDGADRGTSFALL
jgi:membrane protein DedA with SNARE-associated domain